MGAAQARPGPHQAARGRRRDRRRLPHRSGSLVKGVWKTGRWLVRHWRTTVTTAAVMAWWHWWGWPSLAVTVAVLAVGSWCGGGATATPFEPYVGPVARGWWWRWIVYAPRMPRWLRACHLTVADPGQPVTVQVTPFRRTAVRPEGQAAPRPGTAGGRGPLGPVLGRGQGPARPRPDPGGLRPSRPRPRRRPRCGPLPGPRAGPGRGVDRLPAPRPARRRRRLPPTSPTSSTCAGTTSTCARCGPGAPSTARDWHQPLAGGHTLSAGATGAGKNSVGWCPDRLHRPRHPRRAGAGLRDRPQGHGTRLRPPDLPPLRRHLQGRPRPAR